MTYFLDSCRKGAFWGTLILLSQNILTLTPKEKGHSSKKFIDVVIPNRMDYNLLQTILTFLMELQQLRLKEIEILNMKRGTVLV